MYPYKIFWKEMFKQSILRTTWSIKQIIPKELLGLILWTLHIQKSKLAKSIFFCYLFHYRILPQKKKNRRAFKTFNINGKENNHTTPCWWAIKSNRELSSLVPSHVFAFPLLSSSWILFFRISICSLHAFTKTPT